MPRSRPVFFLDRSVGKHHVPEALRAAGANVELHDDHFPADTADAEWIVEVSRRGWAIITKDRRIRYRPLELAAVVAARARLFALTSGNLTGSAMADVLVLHVARMERIVAAERPPFVARISYRQIVVERLTSR